MRCFLLLQSVVLISICNFGSASVYADTIKIKTSRNINGTLKLRVDAKSKVKYTGISFENKDNFGYSVFTIDSDYIELNGEIERFRCEKNDITSLELVSCENLKELMCTNNKIKKLDLSQCPNLVSLECNNNQLSALDNSKCKNLKFLFCSMNELQSLSVENNEELLQLKCDHNQLEEIKLGETTKLSKFFCNDNKLKHLELLNNMELTQLKCNSNELLSLDLSHNKNISILYCQDNKLEKLVTPKNNYLKWIYCNKNNLKSIDLKNESKLSGLYCSENSLTELDLSQQSLLTSLSCENNNIKYLLLSPQCNIRKLSCWNNDIKGNSMNRLISSLPILSVEEDEDRGQLYLINEDLSKENNHITKSQVSRANNKNWDVYLSNKKDFYEGADLDQEEIFIKTKLNENDIFKMKISGKDINIEGVTTTTIANGEQELRLLGSDITITGTIDSLDCVDNKLFFVDVDYCPSLKYLNLANNEIDSLSTKNNINLTSLNLNNNKINNLNLSFNKKLIKVACKGNMIKNLDVDGCKSLVFLDCSFNQLPFLKVEDNTKLEYLNCSFNVIKGLTCSNNSNLKYLDCSANQILLDDMDSLIKSINDGYIDCKELIVVNPITEKQVRGNECSKRQVAWAKAKHWNVGYLDNNDWIPYEGIDEVDTFIVKLESNDLGKISIDNMTDEQLLYVKKGTVIKVNVSPNSENIRLVELKANDNDILETRTYEVIAPTVIKALFRDVTSVDNIDWINNVKVEITPTVVKIISEPNVKLYVYELSGKLLLVLNTDDKGLAVINRSTLNCSNLIIGNNTHCYKKIAL